MLKRLVLLPLLLALLAACATAAGEDADGVDYQSCGVRPRATLPVTFRGNVPIVQGTINGMTAALILDTGATGMALTEAALHRLDLKTDDKHVFTSHGIGGQSQAFAGVLHDFEIDGIHVPDHPVSVLPNTSQIARQHTVDGLFGVSILSVFEVDLDFPRREVTLYAGRICPDTVLPPWKTPFEMVDASKSVRGRFIIPVELDGKQLNALIDTGAEASIVAADVAASLGVTQAALQAGPHAVLVGTGPQTATAYAHVFQEIRIGNDVGMHPMLLVAERAEPDIDMILGADYLKNHHLWLSPYTKRVFIERTGQARASAE
jgi:predicted aspartyl protease